MVLIKNVNDLAIGIGLLLVSLWLLMDPTLIKGFVLATSTPFLARPDIYVKLIAGGLVILSVLLIFKSINLTGRVTEKNKFSFRLPLVTLIPMIAFVLCTLVLEEVGFFISSFVLMTLMCFIYQIKEKQQEFKASKAIYKSLAISCVFSLALVVVLEQIFTHLLKVTLP
jgi:hypothetical protein